MDYIYILGVKIHRIKREEILKQIERFLKSDSFHYIVTINPEFAMEAQKDKEFRKILNDADLSIADGTGLKIASWAFGHNLYRVTGADLTEDALKIAEQKKCSVYFFIWKNGLSDAEDVKKVLKRGFGDSLFKEDYRFDGQEIERDGRDIDWQKFAKAKPDILLVGLGAPFQEKLIYKMIRNGIPSEKSPLTPLFQRGEDMTVKLAMGIGGSFDFLTGKRKRAPKLMRNLGLEWFWRMCRLAQPPYNYFYRFKRIFTAVFIFPFNVVKWRLRMQFCYRKGITAIIVNKENKILLCKSAYDENNWQFLQGGSEKNESVEDTVQREIFEELGTTKIKIIKRLTEKIKYRSNQERHIRRLVKMKYGYKGQVKDIFVVMFLGKDNEIKLDKREFVDYQWVSKDELMKKLHPDRKKVGEIALKNLI